MLETPLTMPYIYKQVQMEQLCLQAFTFRPEEQKTILGRIWSKERGITWPSQVMEQHKLVM